MKTEARKALGHRIEVFGKAVPTMAVAALFLIGAGSAALLDSYGEVTGSSDVTQSVYFVDGNADQVTTSVTASYNGEVAAGTTTLDEFELVNSANRSAEISLKSDAVNITGINQHVYVPAYEDQTFHAEPQGETVGDAGQVNISAFPGDDKVTYEVILPPSYDGGAVALEVSRESGDNYHVGYYPPKTSSGWFIQDPSTGSYDPLDPNGLGNVEEVEYLFKQEQQDGSLAMEITLDRNPAYAPTFGLNAYEQSKGTPPQNTNWRTEGFSFSDSGTSNHLQVSIPDLIGNDDTLTLEPGEERPFRLVTDFDVALDPDPADGSVPAEYFDIGTGKYLVDLEVQPATG